MLLEAELGRSSNASSNAIGRRWISVHGGGLEDPGRAEGPDGFRRLAAGCACLLIRGFTAAPITAAARTRRLASDGGHVPQATARKPGHQTRTKTLLSCHPARRVVAPDPYIRPARDGV
jgi:hypothetical protein